MTPFDAYLRKHGHLPTVKLSGGRSVYAGNGYIAIEESGHRTYIPRSDLPQFLRFAQKTGRLMESSFDPRQAMAEYMEMEEQYLKERRREKKSRRASGRLRWD